MVRLHKNSGRYRFRYLPLSAIFRSAPRILRHDSHPASQHLRTLRPPVSDFHPNQGLLPSDSGNTRLRSQGSSRSPYLRPRSDSTIFRSQRSSPLPYLRSHSDNTTFRLRISSLSSFFRPHPDNTTFRSRISNLSPFFRLCPDSTSVQMHRAAIRCACIRLRHRNTNDHS